MTSIGCSAFYGCESLTSISIPEGVTSIETHTFENCSSLTTVTFPSSVTSIGYQAFTGCSSLKDIIFNAEETPDVDNYTFSGLNVSNVILVVPDNSYEQYKAHPIWRQFWIETPTDIKIDQDTKCKTSDEIFDLQGRKHSTVQKGINIIGRKKIIKN